MILAFLALLYAALHALRLAFALRHLREERAMPVAEVDSPVTILQPILSGDPALRDRLTANLAAGDGAHFVWLVDDDDAEGQRIAADLAAGRPGVRVLSGRPPEDGENPKLLKLIRGAPDAGTIVVLDDDTVLRPGGALRLAARATEGLATAIPLWVAPPRTKGEALVAGFINGQGAATYFAMTALGRNRTINGMAYAVRAADLRWLGGFAAAGHEVTDDWAVARLATRRGLPLLQSVEVAEVAVTVPTLPEAFALLRRWMQFAARYLRANMDGALFSLVVLPGLIPLAGLVLALLTGPLAAILWLGLILSRAAVHARLVRALGGPGGGIVAAALADLLLPLLSLAAAIAPNRMRWRTRHMDLRGGRIRYR